MAWTWKAAVAVVAAALLALATLLRVLLRNANGRRLPPGPRGIPILGCLHLLGNSPPRYLHQLAKRYGSIMNVRLGLTPTIVVSSPDAAELFLKTHDHVFSSKAPLVAAKHLMYKQRNLIFTPYGSYWCNVRKMCTLELLSTSKISSFECMRKEELGLLIDKLKEASRGRVPVDLSAKVSSLSVDMSCRMVFGKKFADEEFNERGFKSVIEEALQLAAVFNLGDYIPPFAALDLQGLTKKMKAVSKLFDGFFEKIIDEHLQSKDENRTKDFVDVMLEFLGTAAAEYNIDRRSIKALMLDMFAGSIDTSATSIDWALSELIKHPRVMKKVQRELEEKVGKDRMVEESDLENLEYLDMVVKETFRLHPVVPLLYHAPTEEYNVNGFFIPQNARIIINVFAIARDPSAWPDADKFWPERFADNEVDLSGRHFQLLPFGAGRRGCPGMQLGLTVVRLVVAQLIHCFDWELPHNMRPEDLDMTEVFSFVTPRAAPLHAIPTCRLNS